MFLQSSETKKWNHNYYVIDWKSNIFFVNLLWEVAKDEIRQYSCTQLKSYLYLIYAGQSPTCIYFTQVHRKPVFFLYRSIQNLYSIYAGWPNTCIYFTHLWIYKRLLLLLWELCWNVGNSGAKAGVSFPYFNKHTAKRKSTWATK